MKQVSLCLSWLSYVCLILCPQIHRDLHASVSCVLELINKFYLYHHWQVKLIFKMKILLYS